MRNTGIALLLAIIVAPIAFAGCATTQAKPQFQVREFQTRSFETADVKAVVKALMNVLQDDGYVTKQANLELGFVSATKEYEEGLKLGELLNPFKTVGEMSRNTIVEATFNVSQYGEKSRVRATFQTKTLDRKGRVNKIKQIDDEQFYTDFFSKLNKGIFIDVEQEL